MKILLDENLPEQLKEYLKEHDVSTVDVEGWRSVKNGELLQRMIATGFDAFITLDTKIQYQQSFAKYPIPMIVLRGPIRKLQNILDFAPLINRLLKRRLQPGPHELFLNDN